MANRTMKTAGLVLIAIAALNLVSKPLNSQPAQGQTPPAGGRGGRGRGGASPDPNVNQFRGLAQDTFNGPCAVVTAWEQNSRIVKFNKDGKFLMEFGKKGTGPGEFDTPHAVAMDSQGRLFVGDRANSRIQIFAQDGKLLEIWRQFGRPSGLYIDANDVLYSADSESNPPRNPGFKRGIRIGSVKDGKVRAFIPYTDMEHIDNNGARGVEGVSADAAGNVYGCEVAEADLKKYFKK